MKSKLTNSAATSSSTNAASSSAQTGVSRLKASSSSSSSLEQQKQRTGYHASAMISEQQVIDNKCNNCRYRVPYKQQHSFRCTKCGTYMICDYCLNEYIDKGSGPSQSSSSRSGAVVNPSKIHCIYCWSRHSLTDICVKTLKSLGFIASKGTNKIAIQTLTKDQKIKLTNLRVIQKSLVYVIGIAPSIANESTLKSVDYFGQYGNLLKVVVNTNNVYNATRGGPSYSAYLTFSTPRESAIAILAVDQFVLGERMLRASFGTSKFCQFFLNGQRCSNKDCLYLHELRADLEAYTKEDMQSNKFIFQEQQKIAIKLSKALDLTLDEFTQYNIDHNPLLKQKANSATQSKKEPQLPASESIYQKEFHFLDEPLSKRHTKEQAKSQQASSTNTAAKTALKSSASQQPNASSDKADNNQNQNEQSNQNNYENEESKQSANTTTAVKPKKVVIQPGASAGSTTNQNNNNNQTTSSSLMFSNQKDESNQARANSKYRPNNIFESKDQQSDKQTVQNERANIFESLINKKPLTKEPPTQASQQDTSNNDNTKKTAESNNTTSTVSQVDGDNTNSAQQINATTADANASSRFGKKPVKKKGKKVIVVEKKVAAAQSPELSPPATKESNTVANENGQKTVNVSNVKNTEEEETKTSPQQTINANSQAKKGVVSPLQDNNYDGVNSVFKTPTNTTSDKQVNVVVSNMNKAAAVASQQAQEQSNQQQKQQIINQDASTSSIVKDPLTNPNNKSAQIINKTAQKDKLRQSAMQQLSEDQLQWLSPMLFRRKESRFQFAHSVDPVKNYLDNEEIKVPKSIQELISRSIRTLSNSISNKSQQRVFSGNGEDEDEDEDNSPNEQFLDENDQAELAKELSKHWLTKGEEQMNSPSREDKDIANQETATDSNNPFSKIHKVNHQQSQQQQVKWDVKRIHYKEKNQKSPQLDEARQSNKRRHAYVDRSNRQYRS